jgi:hypothetical protein
MRIAIGEKQDCSLNTGKEYARKGGLLGGPLRARKLSGERRREIASLAAQARWNKKKP